MSATDAQIELIRRLAMTERGLTVVVTETAKRVPACSLVNAGVFEHPALAGPVVAFTVRGTAKKLANLRARPSATAVFRSGWEWIAVRGSVRKAGPRDPFPELNIPIPELLRNVFTAAGGTHESWDEYDRVMAQEGRTAVFIAMDHVYGNPGYSSIATRGRP